jgi:hypothetical protein
MSKPASVLVFALLFGVALSGKGQIPGGQREATVADMALDWSRGRFASPLICELEGELVRGLRRVLITPGPSHERPRVNRIVFVDLEVDEASRCFAELVGDVPNVTGSIQIHLLSSRRSDTARRDFREWLRRKRGFEFRIAAGGLKLQPVTQPPSPARGVDFRGGHASLRTLEPGSDDSRLLAPFPSPRKLLLELTARDGTKLSFPLYMTDLR